MTSGRGTSADGADARRPAFLLLHGFTGAPASWDPIVARLPPDARVLRPALAGHGARRSASWAAEIDRLRSLLDAEAVERAHLVGYSMGGRLGWSLLAAAPERFSAATLIGAHPGLGDARERAQRSAQDARWAQLLEREGVDAFVDAWSALPMWESQRALSPEERAPQDAIRRAHDPAGLAHALEVLGLARMPPAPLASIPTPIALVVGARDRRHRALAEAARARLSRSRLHVIPGAGHNVVLERPDALAALLTRGEDGP